MQKPSPGRIVHVVGVAAKSNGTDVCPGIITRVWSEHPDGGWTVNLTTFPDAATPRIATSARLVETEDQARAIARSSTAAYCPPRV